MDLRAFIEGVAVLMLPAGFATIMWHRFISGKAVGARTIQLTVVVMLIPAILILGLEKILDPATIGTLIGALTGYVLSGIGEYRPNPKKDSDAVPGDKP